MAHAVARQGTGLPGARQSEAGVPRYRTLRGAGAYWRLPALQEVLQELGAIV